MAVTIPIFLDEEKRLVLEKTVAEKLSRGRLKLDSSFKGVSYADGTNFPERVALDGTWQLNEEHDLEFGVSASSVWFPGMTISFKTGIISAKSDKIVFSARLTDYGGGVMATALAFSGRWQADKNNRLTFGVTRSGGKTDRLVFEGAWQVGKNNEIFYEYSTQKLKTKEKKDFSFGLSGKWDLGSKRIAYKLEGAGDSVLIFSGSLETPSIRAKNGEIRYTVGMRFVLDGKEKQVIKSVAIHGTWKISSDLRIGFEIANSKAKKNVISFLVEKTILGNGKASIFLKTENGRDFGIELKVSKEFARDLEVFTMLKADNKGGSALLGMRKRF